MCECGKGGKLRRGKCGACYARWLRRQHMEPVTRGENVRRAMKSKPCVHCGLSVVPPNMSRHITARHLGSGS